MSNQGRITLGRVALASAAAILCVTPAFAGQRASPPAGATAFCRDGTYSFSQHHSGSCSHHGGVARFLGAAAAPKGGAPAPAGPGGKPALGRSVDLAAPTRTSGCVEGPKPDRRCSPGADYSGLTKGVLCSSSFHTGDVRNVPDSVKHADEADYGMTPRAYGRTIEIDHIVSLELGGSNNIANLYPEPGSGTANYHVKDKLENKLHSLVCSGSMTLRAAQSGIARNWETLYRRVFGTSPAT